MKEFFAILIGIIVTGLLHFVFWRRSRRKKIVSKHTPGVADAALESLVTMGWPIEDARRMIGIAQQGCPDGDESELVNIAIRL